MMAREAVEINGVSELAIMKMDVLDGLNKIKVCVSYKYKGSFIREFARDFEVLKNLKPVYKEFPGWPKTRFKPRSYRDLHPNAKAYLKMLSSELKAEIKMVSVGSARKDTIFLD